MKNTSSNKKNSLLIKDTDYEKYQLVLPYRFMFGRKKNRFIYSELEKLPPCFSDEFCFDSNIRKFSRKGLMSDVLVIHKYRLAEYEAERGKRGAISGTFAGSGFYVNSYKRHRFFKNENIKKELCFELIFSIIALLLFLIMGISKIKNHPVESIGEPVIIPSHIEETEPEFLAKDFFTAIKKNNGRILSFRWENNSNFEALEAKIKNVFPEMLGELKTGIENMGPVNYENGSPLIQLSLISKNNARHGDSVKHIETADYSDFYQNNRNILFDNGASLKEEKLKPYFLRFTCNERVLKSLLSSLAENNRKAGIKLSSINIIQIIQNAGSGNEVLADFEISITYAESANLNDDGFFDLLCENTELFGERKKQLSQSKALPEKKTDSKKTKTEMPGAKKNGEIKNSEGKTIQFYKTQDGKIQKVMEEK